MITLFIFAQIGQVYKAESDSAILFLLLVVAVVFAVRYYFEMDKEKERRRNLEMFLESANREIKRLNEKEKLLLEEEKKLKSEIHQEKIENLRFALNPHAFKNTLNTVKLLAERTTESIDKLSGVLDYMVYDSTVNFVSLEKEILFMENFLAFNQLRIRDLEIVRIDNSVDRNHPFFTQPVLPPMITAYFIENAFKHGLLENKGDLDVRLEMRGNRFFYTVSNPINPIKFKGKGGVGYKNMKRRLDIIFPKRYTLDPKLLGSRFVAHLEIHLHIQNEYV